MLFKTLPCNIIFMLAVLEEKLSVSFSVLLYRKLNNIFGVARPSHMFWNYVMLVFIFGLHVLVNGATYRGRTDDLLITSELLYQLS